MKPFVLNVWGDFACFTQRELKAERFSYPVITPSAARAIFDSIYISYGGFPVRPLFRWQVRRVEILSPITYIDLLRNEVKNKIGVRQVQGWMKEAERNGRTSQRAPEMSLGHTPRQTLALQNVRYRLHAEAVLYAESAADRTRLERVFERRARRGQCMRQPYLGCREFPAYFELADDAVELPVAVTEEIGWMPYDVFDLSQPNSSATKANVSVFFARIQDGVLEIPAYESSDVRKLGLSR